MFAISQYPMILAPSWFTYSVRYSPRREKKSGDVTSAQYSSPYARVHRVSSLIVITSYSYRSRLHICASEPQLRTNLCLDLVLYTCSRVDRRTNAFPEKSRRNLASSGDWSVSRITSALLPHIVQGLEGKLPERMSRHNPIILYPSLRPSKRRPSWVTIDLNQTRTLL